MSLKIFTPLYINNTSASIFPNIETVSSTDRLFIVCDNQELAEALITCINEQLAAHKSISATNLNNFVDEIITSNGKLSTASLALALLNKNGCLVMQMGKSRVLHFSPTTEEIEYDSSNHILDTLSSKAKTQLLTKINSNDTILVTLTDRVDSQRVLRLMCDHSEGDNNTVLKRLTTLLEKHREDAPATYVLRFASPSGLGGNFKTIVKDINWKWVTVFLILAAIIAAISALSFNTDIFHWDNKAEIADTVSTESTDTTRVLTPAIDEIPSIDDTEPKDVPDATTSQQDVPRQDEPAKQNEGPNGAIGSSSVYDQPTTTTEPSVKQEPKTEPSQEPQQTPEPVITPEE